MARTECGAACATAKYADYIALGSYWVSLVERVPIAVRARSVGELMDGSPLQNERDVLNPENGPAPRGEYPASAGK
jgi:hypothetical protein